MRQIALWVGVVLLGWVSTAHAGADDIVLSDGSTWTPTTAKDGFTYDDYLVSTASLIDIGIDCQAGMRFIAAAARGPAPITADGWTVVSLSNVGATACHERAGGGILFAEIFWSKQVPDPARAASVSLFLKTIADASAQWTPSSNTYDLFKPALAHVTFTRDTGFWRFHDAPTDHTSMFELVWPRPVVTKQILTGIGRLDAGTRCDASGSTPAWASTGFYTVVAANGGMTACFDGPDRAYKTIADTLGADQGPLTSDETSLVRGWMTALRVAIVGTAATPAPAVTTGGGLAPIAPTGTTPDPTTPTPTPAPTDTPVTPPETTTIHRNPLHLVQLSGIYLTPGGDMPEEGYGASLNYRRPLLTGRITPMLEAEVGYATQSKYLLDVGLELHASLAPQFAVSGSVGYDGIGVGSDTVMPGAMHVDGNLYYGGAAYLNLYPLDASAGYYLRNDDTTDHEIRVELGYFIGSKYRLVGRYDNYGDTGATFALGVRFY